MQGRMFESENSYREYFVISCRIIIRIFKNMKISCFDCLAALFCGDCYGCSVEIKVFLSCLKQVFMFKESGIYTLNA